MSHSYIGTDILGEQARGNAKAGVFLGADTHSTTVGSTDPNLLTLVSGNLGNGIEMRDTHGNTVIGTYIGTDVGGSLPLPNGRNGVFIGNSFDNVIGRRFSGTGGSYNEANRIAFNGGNGVLVFSGTGNGIHVNSIHSNTLPGCA